MEKHSKLTQSFANFCKDSCPVCTKGRENGEGLLYHMVKVERHVCPMCRSYKKVYGVPAHKKIE